MKLLACHIENFGKFSNADFDFSEGVSCFFGENGYGKTTLACFIKSMFYGLPNQRGDNFNERKRFFPFNGGKFGGNVRFEYNGKEYRIERVFDKKSEARDDMRVYRGGMPSDELGAVPGVSLFGIDEDSFKRIIFITADDVDISSAKGISAKLNNYIDDTDGENNFETAVNALDKARKNYKADRGSGGKISAKNYEIADLRADIENLQKIYDGLPALYAEHKAITEEIALLDGRAESVRALALTAQQWDTYDGYCADAEAEKIKLKELQSKYPDGLPESGETEELGGLIKRRLELESEIKAAAFTADKSARLAEYEKKFASGAPSEHDIKEAEKGVGRLAELDAELRVNNPAGVSEAPAPPKAKAFSPRIFIIVAIVAALCAVAGIVTVFFNTVAGIVLIAVGAVALAADGFLFLLKKTERQSVGYSAEAAAEIAERRQKAVEERDGLLRSLTGFFVKYGADCGDMQGALISLKSSVRAYLDLVSEREECNRKEGEIRGQIEDCLGNMHRLLEKYGVADLEPESALKKFENDFAEMSRLEKSVEEKKAKAENYKKEKGLTVRAEKPADAGEITGALEKKRQELAVLNRRIAEDETEAEKLAEKRNALAAAEETLKEYKIKHGLIEAAERELKNAEQALKDRYVAPVKEKFLKYASETEERLGLGIQMDQNFRVRFDRDGELREDGHLSAGQRSVYALCLRLALTDNMFEKEKPFIIMDDPFVNLDEEHMQKVKRLIKKLSENTQLIYFCCHESRKI